MTERNALEGVIDLWLDLLSPLVDAVQDDRTFAALLAQMSWTAQTIDLDGLATAIDTMADTVEQLREEISLESLPELVQTLVSLREIATSLAEFAQSLAIAAGDPAASAEVLANLAADILQHLVLLWIGRSSPAAYSALQLVGLIDRAVPTALSTGGANPLLQRAAVSRPVLALDALGRLLSDPNQYLTERLGVTDLNSVTEAEQMLQDVFLPLRDLLTMAGGRGVVGIEELDPLLLDTSAAVLKRRATFLVALPVVVVAEEPVTSWLSLETELVPTGLTGPAGDAGPGISLTPSGDLNVSVALPRSRLDLAVTAGLASIFIPKAGPPAVHGAPDGVHLRLAFALVPGTAGAPALSLGSKTLGLTITGFQAVVESRFGRTADPRLDLDINAAVEKACFVLAPGDGDGFLAKVLPADGLKFDFDLGLGWSNRRGVYFSGAASLDAEFPLHVSLLGVLTIDIVHLVLAADDAGIRISVAASATLQLGPISASVQRMGLLAKATFPRTGGNLGPLDIQLAFLPPRGVGMVVDASVVKGGGFILNDPDNGRYAGILQLKIGDIVTVTAIGLVTTRMPDGESGFSLVVIITATFPPIQIGFGFSLSGLGGLLGIHRTMELPALRDKVRTGALDSILFPVDPVNRMTEVLSDIESVFPAAQGRFTFGVLARLGWGSPQLVRVDLGLIICLPAPLSIALIGRLSAALPDEEAPVVVLHLDVAGGLDLGRKELWVEAVLHDSRVAVFDISGGFALRTAWGDEPTFILSVGGFNPAFTPPANFNPPQRVTIALGSGDNPRIALAAYLAITSNTIQFGANLDVHAEATFLGVWSVDLQAGFDALVVLVPFSFVVDFRGGIMVKHNGNPFIGASFYLSLSGPQPVTASGYAEVEFFGTHRVPFNITVGEPAQAVELTAVDPLEQLLSAIESVESWSTLPPAGSSSVATRELTGTGLFAHPNGALGFRQRIVPLDVVIERYAGLRLSAGPRQYSLTYSFARGGASTPQYARTAVRDAWAPADLFTLTDDQKLALPSFTQLVSGDSGIAIAAEAAGSPVTLDLDAYETSVIDADEWAPARLDATGAYTRSADVAMFLHQANGHEELLRAGVPAPAMKVSLAEPEFAVASTQTLATDGQTYASWVEARAAAAGQRDMQLVDAHEALS